MEITATETIAAPPEQIAAIMFDPNWEPLWIPPVKKVELESDHSDWGVGLRVRRWGNIFGPTSWVAEIAECEYPIKLIWRHTDGFLRGDETYEIFPGGLGCLVSICAQHDDSDSPFLRWLWPILFRRAYGKNLRRLKVIVEQREARRLAEAAKQYGGAN